MSTATVQTTTKKTIKEASLGLNVGEIIKSNDLASLKQFELVYPKDMPSTKKLLRLAFENGSKDIINHILDEKDLEHDDLVGLEHDVLLHDGVKTNADLAIELEDSEIIHKMWVEYIAAEHTVKRDILKARRRLFSPINVETLMAIEENILHGIIKMQNFV